MKQFDPIKHKNSQPFSTPEGYFEDFTQRMMAGWPVQPTP